MAKIERTKNATRNIIFGNLLKIYQIVIPFLMRTAMIYCLGVEYLGLNSLFSSILQVLNLAELGVGSAMVYSMYKPIAEDDEETICALMNLYKLYYRVIGAVILVAGLAICPFINSFIKSGVPADMNVYVLYLMNLGATVLSYWLFAYKNCLLSAHQRVDITSKISLITNTVLYLIQFFILFFIKNYYYYIGIVMLMQVVTNIVTAIKVDKMYPNFKAKGKLDKKEIKTINGRVRDLFTAKLGSVVFNSVDTIVISAFLGLTVLAVYQNYYYILNSVVSFFAVIYVSITAGMGNSFVSESSNKNYYLFKKLTFIINWLLCISCCCFVCLYQVFMKIWVGEKYMLSNMYVYLLIILFVSTQERQLWCTVKDAAGIWHEDRFRPLCSSAANLVLNIILVKKIGLIGVILSSIVSCVFVGWPWLLYNVLNKVYKQNFKDYSFVLLKYLLVIIFSVVLTGYISGIIRLEGLLGLIINGLIAVIISNIIWIAIFFRDPMFTESIKILNGIIRKK